MDIDRKHIETDNEDMTAVEQILTEALLRTTAPCPDINGEWERLNSRQRRGKATTRRIVLWSAVAAAAAVIAAVFILMPRLDNGDTIYTAKAEPREIRIIDSGDGAQSPAKDETAKRTAIARTKSKTVVVPEGKDYSLTLPDGTQVWLNANSTLTYPTEFSRRNRTVRLVGEAYFDVACDEKRPFTVETGSISTKVLGTEFNIRAYTAADTHVTLVNGSVSVSSDSHDKVISPGEDATVEDGRLVVSEVNVDDVTCWRDGIELFDDATLHDILVRIGSWYGMSVMCANEDVLSRRLHYMYDRRSDVSGALKTLGELSNSNIKTEKNIIFVE